METTDLHSSWEPVLCDRVEDGLRARELARNTADFLILKQYVNSAPYKLEPDFSLAALLSAPYLSELGLSYMH